MIVVDTSTVIAVMRNEPGAERIAGRVAGAAISAVNLAELVGHGVRSGLDAREVRADLTGFELQVFPFDAAAAVETAALLAETKPYGLSLGDRACLALAKTLDVPVVTADRNWRALDIGVHIELFR